VLQKGVQGFLLVETLQNLLLGVEWRDGLCRFPIYEKVGGPFGTIGFQCIFKFKFGPRRITATVGPA